MSIKLYGHPDSGHAFKVRLYLALHGIEHDYEVIDLDQPRDQRPLAFREASRFSEVPCLVDEGQALVQSNAILLHLQDHYGPPLEDTEKAQITEWLFWEANKIGLCLPQLRSARYLGDTSYNEGALQWLQARYDADVARIAQELEDGRRFIVGDSVTAADCSLCGYLVFADQARVAVPEAVSEWLDRLASERGWQAPAILMSA